MAELYSRTFFKSTAVDCVTRSTMKRRRAEGLAQGRDESVELAVRELLGRADGLELRFEGGSVLALRGEVALEFFHQGFEALHFKT